MNKKDFDISIIAQGFSAEDRQEYKTELDLPLDNIPCRSIEVSAEEVNYSSSVKKDKLTKNVWKKEVYRYQERLYYSDIGQNFLDALKASNFVFVEDVSKELVVSVLISIYRAICSAEKEPGKWCHPMPVTSLWSFTSPFSASIYKDNKAVQKFVAATITKALDNLYGNDVIYFGHYEIEKDLKVRYTKGKCRKIGIDSTFIDNYNLVITKRFLDMLDNNMAAVDSNYRMRPAKKGENLRKENTNETTLAVVEKLKKMQFRFNIEALCPDVLATIPDIGNRKSTPVIESLVYALNGINIYTNEPQYLGSFHKQDSGRLHTINGAINLSKDYRKLFIAPLVKENKLVDVDLACAQLLILCNILELPKLKDVLLKLLAENNNSIWSSIGNSKTPKAAKKIIVYSFAFGANYSSIAGIATTKLKAKGLNYKVTTVKDINPIFNELLAPLKEARAKFFEDHSLSKIVGGHTPKIVRNAFGNNFRLYQEGINSVGGLEVSEHKIAGRLLAFLAQGAEQAIIQPLILKCPYNITTFQYDGFTYEVPEEALELSVKQLRDSCAEPLTFEVLN